MKAEYLSEMSVQELDDYAVVLGIDVTAAKTKAAKIKLISESRERVAEVSVLGTTFAIHIKRLHDKRITDKVNTCKTDADYEKVAKMVLGDKQYARLVERVTDEDGTIDTDALGLAISTIFRSDKLKNF